MNLTIQLLIETGNVDFMFNEFYEHSKTKNLEIPLQKAIQDFVYANKISIERFETVSKSQMFE